MTDDTNPGFEHDGSFYALIPVTEWTTEDADISHRITGLGVDVLFFGDTIDPMLSRAALVAVAMHHAKPDVPAAQIIDVCRRARPLIDFTPIGLAGDDEDPKDESVPDDPSLSSSSGTSDDSMVAISET